MRTTTAVASRQPAYLLLGLLFGLAVFALPRAARAATTPSVYIQPSSGNNQEGHLTLTGFFLLTTPNNPSAVTVPFTLSGTAVPGKNYKAPISPVTIPAGKGYASIPIYLFDDGIRSPDLTIIVTLGTPTNATLGTPSSATQTIHDSDTLVLNQRWSSPTNIPCCSWTAVDGSSTTGYVGGGPLMVQMNISTPAGGSGATAPAYETCRPLVDGVWMGGYSHQVDSTRDPFFSEGATLYPAAWTSSKVYANVPNGVHTFEVQCASSQGIFIVNGQPTVPKPVPGQVFSSWTIIELRPFFSYAP